MRKRNVDYTPLFIEYNRLPLGGVVKWPAACVTPLKQLFAKRGLEDRKDYTARVSDGTCYIRRLTTTTIH